MPLYCLLQTGEVRRSYRQNYSALGALCPGAVYVSDTSNYCHKTNKQKIWSCMLRGNRSAKEIFFLYLFPLSWNQRALEKHSRFTINLWKQSLVNTENNLYLWMCLCEPTLCNAYYKLVYIWTVNYSIIQLYHLNMWVDLC